MTAATSSLIALSILTGNDPAGLNALQQMLEPHTHTLILLWTTVWLATTVYVLIVLFREGDKDA